MQRAALILTAVAVLIDQHPAAADNTFPTTGNAGINITSPGEALDIRDGSMLMLSRGEREIRMVRDSLVIKHNSGVWGAFNPTFKLGRIITAGDGSPAFRVLYEDKPAGVIQDSVTERSVFEFDSKGIVASVKDDAGSHFEGFIRGNTEPLFRLNSYPHMQLELGPGGNAVTDVYLRRQAASTLAILTGDVERMRIDHMGRVGIGTNNPQAAGLELHNMPGLVDSQILVANDDEGNALLTLDRKRDYRGASIQFRTDGYVNWTMGLMRWGGSPTYSFGLSSTGDLNTSAELIVTTNGDVGIGTATPQSKLAVNGTITAHELVCTLDGWPDYVFEEDYRLRSLDEVEDFIADNGHLPDIPSEQQVLGEGVRLGQMQASLLQKVEELTLYMIELNKENEALKARLAQLENAR